MPTNIVSKLLEGDHRPVPPEVGMGGLGFIFDPEDCLIIPVEKDLKYTDFGNGNGVLLIDEARILYPLFLGPQAKKYVTKWYEYYMGEEGEEDEEDDISGEIIASIVLR